MTIPKSVTDTIAALRAERSPLTARLDAIDLVLENLTRVWPVDDGGEKSGGGGAAARRDELLAVITQHAGGCTLKDLRQAAPPMRWTDRSNALATLKRDKQIRRVGTKWISTRRST